MSNPFPALTAEYVDTTLSPINILFPNVQNYADGRLLSLILGLIIALTTLFVYCTGICSANIARLDACSTETYIAGSINNNSSNASSSTTSVLFRSIPRTSKYGGIMTLAATLVGLAVLLDVIIQFSTTDYGYETTTFHPPLLTTPGGENGKLELELVAESMYLNSSCGLLAMGNRGNYMQAIWKLDSKESIFSPLENLTTRRESVGGGEAPGVTTTRKLCTFHLKATNALLATPFFSGSSTSPSSTLPSSYFTIGSHLQIIAWTIKVYDGKVGAYTKSSPSNEIPKDIAFLNSTNTNDLVVTTQRVHTLNTRLYPVTYIDRTFFDSTGDIRSFGHRASFLTYTVIDASPVNPEGASTAGIPTTQRGDTFVITFDRADMVATTIKVPRLGVLPLIGIITGLWIAVAFVFRLFYEYGNACCWCVDIRGERVKARYCKRCKGEGSSSSGQNYFEGKEAGDDSHLLAPSRPFFISTAQHSHSSSSAAAAVAAVSSASWEAATAAAVKGALAAPSLSATTATGNGKSHIQPPSHTHTTKTGGTLINRFREPSMRLVSYTPKSVGGQVQKSVKDIFKRPLSFRSSSTALREAPPASSAQTQSVAQPSTSSGQVTTSGTGTTVSGAAGTLASATSTTSINIVGGGGDDDIVPDITNPFFGHGAVGGVKKIIQKEMPTQ